MASTLSSLVNNLSEKTHKIKYKYRHYDRNCETCGIEYEVWNCFLKYKKFKDDSVKYTCLCFN